MTSLSNQYKPARSGLINQAGKKRRNSDALPSDIGRYVPLLQPGSGESYVPNSRQYDRPYWQEIAILVGEDLLRLGRGMWTWLRSWRLRHLFSVRVALVLSWFVVLWMYEDAIFRYGVSDCQWDEWETWPKGSTPHHVLLIADPQLVDPHTYPGRPWPLSTLTIRYTDLYMRKSFQQILKQLSPDTGFFLGDLFDGGREWSAGVEKDPEKDSPDRRWRRYDSSYWLKEYARFSRIFFDPWLRTFGSSEGNPPNRKLIASLPGNHDLGLGGGIRLPVRKRFQAYFGNGNRFDIVGNHSFVSLDTVSLSAKDQPNTPSRQGINEEVHNKEVWAPVDQFLHTAKTEKARTIERELRIRNGGLENEPLEHVALELDDLRAHTLPLENHKITDIPSIILTHVPLYRAEGTPCGPLRERYPPLKSANGETLESDGPNSIHVQAGVQYQNVLTPAISDQIVNLVGDVTHVFSGDDHDYCDVVHRGYTSKNGGIREITVKSISWAMGVRHPGVVLLSLWNPVDADGKAIGSKTESTIQTHLCLLPDQLKIFINYAWFLALNLLVLLARAIVGGPEEDYSEFLKYRSTNGRPLSLTEAHSEADASEESISASARSPPARNRLAVRSSAGRSRELSPSGGYGHDISVEQAEIGHANGEVDAPYRDIELNEPAPRKRVQRYWAIWEEFRLSLVQVAIPVFLFYAYLLWNS